MKINPIFKMRSVANEHLILLQGTNTRDTSKVIAFNSTSLLLWENLHDKEFELDDVKHLLLDNFEVDSDTAAHDATEWVKVLQDNGLLL